MKEAVVAEQVAMGLGQTVREKVSTVKDTMERTVHWEELPDWMRIDGLIRHGYRRQLNSFGACFQSLFYPHNELINIWSHLLPGLCYLTFLLGADDWILREQTNLLASHQPIIKLYVAGTAGCLLLSVCDLFDYNTTFAVLYAYRSARDRHSIIAAMHTLPVCRLAA